MIRALELTDHDQIKALHGEMGLDYKFPNLSDGLTAGGIVCEENGKIIAATAMRLQPEAFLWISPNISPAEKWDAIRRMQLEGAKVALHLGFSQVVAYLPPCISRFFKRMKMLGWEQPRDGWTTWIYEVRR